MQAQAELGFIVVQIDGMGTSNRSKAFHDVAWKNLRDAGFPDRILWHKAVARSTRGTTSRASASTADRPAARTRWARCSSTPSSTRRGRPACGCHDNRMDKIWWNEQWMGWGRPEYSACRTWTTRAGSRASCCSGCPASSTPTSILRPLRRPHALVKADKTLDPGGAGRKLQQRREAGRISATASNAGTEKDFFVQSHGREAARLERRAAEVGLDVDGQQPRVRCGSTWPEEAREVAPVPSRSHTLL